MPDILENATLAPQVRVKRSKGRAKQFKDRLSDDVVLEMVEIPQGEFMMSSPEDEEGRDSSEQQHLVRVPRFFLGKYPVTQAQWRAVSAWEPVNRDLKPAPSHFKVDDLPVERVSWYDAVEFCDRLSQHTHRQYRLPSESEWEYACRAGTITPFHFGETITAEVANYDARRAYGSGPKGTYSGGTTPVGKFRAANAFGLYDMHGNVWELCQDHWHSSYEKSPNDGSAWLSSDEKARRILRGGSWLEDPQYCRSARRDSSRPVTVYDGIGFRVACASPRTL